MSPITSPMYSSGIVTSTFMIGSRSTAPAFCHSILECHGSGNVECHLGGVDLVVGTVVYVSVNAQYWESAEDTGLGSLFDTLADCRDVFLRNRTADNGWTRT